MSFWQITAANFWSMGVQFVFLLWMSGILLGRIPRRGMKQGMFSALVGLALVMELSLVGAVCYRTGVWNWGHGAGRILFLYFMLGSKVLYLRFLYRAAFRDCVLSGLMIEILSSFGEFLGELYIFGKIYNLSVAAERRSYLLWFLVISPACLLLCGLAIDKSGQGEIYKKWLEQEEMHKGILFLLVFYPILFDLPERAAINGDAEIAYRLLPVFLLLLIHLIFVYVGRDQQQKQHIIAQQTSLRQQAIYIEKMEEMQSELRRFRHDFKNMMAGMYLQVKEGDLDAVQTFIQEVTGDFDRQVGGQIRLLNQLGNIRVPEVKSLLLEKLAVMRQEEICCELEALSLFETTRMRGTDLCRCLGILLDNAMDEVRGKKDGRIHLMISSRNGCTTFRIKNTLYGAVDFGRLGTAGYTTRGNGRGIGLESYGRILKRYDFVFSFTAVQDGCFVQELKIQE